MARSQKSLLLGKLRQSYGENKLLCNQAGDEIVSLRKQKLELLDIIQDIGRAAEIFESDLIPASLVDRMDAVLEQNGRAPT